MNEEELKALIQPYLEIWSDADERELMMLVREVERETLSRATGSLYALASLLDERFEDPKRMIEMASWDKRHPKEAKQ